MKVSNPKINKLAVFCGSKSGSDDLYAKHAETLGRMLGEHGVELIFGGGNKGLMGLVANAAMASSCKVRGVIPSLLTKWEHQHEQITELLIVDDMHVRKRTMYEMCDAVIVLPGGFGTLDELFEVLTWNQLSIHNKQVFIMNTHGFYDHLIAHLHKMAGEGFLYSKPEECVIILSDPAEMNSYLTGN